MFRQLDRLDAGVLGGGGDHHPSAELPEMCRRTHPDPDDPIFNDYTGCASEWLKENDW
jgi:hypothetical protein